MTDRPQPELLDHDEQVTAVIRGVVRMDELPGFFDRSFGALAQVLAAQDVVPRSAAFALYHGAPAEQVDLEVGFVTGDPIEPDGDVVVGSLPGGRIARTVHAGSFDDLGGAWGALMGEVVALGLTPGPTMWEVYLTEPSPDMDPADLRTELNVLVS
ncbi:MAG: GyrI-like domain-containing protein [Actinomycetota bacterium]|nr:GyrI-like domain-containing protein [Actinomycetota bacterium]